jgi:tRNA U34 2-thiouridine synthase MnmA/TrmU
MKPKAKVLLSGGLDSMLAVKVLQKQGIKVKGVAYESNFFNADKARAAAEQLGVPLEIIDISEDLLAVVKNPQCGHGKCLNPCIDCHALMVRKVIRDNPSNPYHPCANFIEHGSNGSNGSARDNDDLIVATGEVLGQRPMSQNKQALERVTKLAGREILRPLSAQLLPETNYEKEGLIDRKKLLDISGRGRNRQMELAKKFGIKDYPSPAGGCLLTEKEFCKKLGEMIKYWPECTPEDVELLKCGRAFWVKHRTLKSITVSAGSRRQLKIKSGGTNGDKSTNSDYEWALIVVGRNKTDNEVLAGLAKKGDFMVELKDEVGPLTVVRIFNFQFSISRQFSNYQLPIPSNLDTKELNLEKPKDLEKIIKTACLFTGYHAPKARGKEINFQLRIIN